MRQQKRLGIKGTTQKRQGHDKLGVKMTVQEHRLQDLRVVNQGGRRKPKVEKNQERELYQGSSSTGDKNTDEYILVELTDIRKSLQCPICLGIMRKTRAMTECMHRFCKECIEKSIRLRKKECPICRRHCPSRRSLREDPRFDELIAQFFPDIDKYEEEEAVLHEEEARNEKMQASTPKTFRRQSQALCTKSKGSQESQSSSDNDDADRNVVEVEGGTSTPVQVLRPYGMFTWGARRVRGYKRDIDGSNEGLHRTDSRTNHLQGLKRDGEAGMLVMIFSLDGDQTQRIPPSCHLCKPACPLRLIRENSIRADEIEVFLVKSLTNNISILMSILGASKASTIDMVKANAPSKNDPIVDVRMEELYSVDYQKTLEQVRSQHRIEFGHTILAYRRKRRLPDRGPIVL